MADLPAIFAALPHLAPDDAERFAEDIEAIRRSEVREDYDPWNR
jgi:hypothetical protein